MPSSRNSGTGAGQCAEETTRAIAEFVVAIKGPLTTPVGGGIRSLNVALRQILDLYACVRPVRYFEGVPSPVKQPERLDVVIFRENTEDVYAGVECASRDQEARRLIKICIDKLGNDVRGDSGIGIKPMSGIRHRAAGAPRHPIRPRTTGASVTLVHKGNIMKFTEGAFRDWGYELAAREFGTVVTEDGPGQGSRRQARRRDGGHQGSHRRRHVPADAASAGRVLRAGDAQPQRRLSLRLPARRRSADWAWRPAPTSVTAALFEATHGTAPKYAGQDKVNPGSLILSAA